METTQETREQKIIRQNFEPGAAADRKFGPRYPKLAGLDKWRKAGPVAKMWRQDTRDYAAAVMKRIATLNRAALSRALEPETRAPCASGTWYSDGKEIAAAIGRQNADALQAAARRDREKRTDEQVMKDYKSAIAEKHARLAAAIAGAVDASQDPPAARAKPEPIAEIPAAPIAAPMPAAALALAKAARPPRASKPRPAPIAAPRPAPIAEPPEPIEHAPAFKTLHIITRHGMRAMRCPIL